MTTMKIRLLTSICGHRYEGGDSKKGKCLGAFGHKEGAVIDWPEGEAKRFIEKGMAEEVQTKQPSRA